MLAIQILILVVLIILSALFSGIETALMSVSEVKVEALLKQRRRGSKALSRLKEKPHRLIITILIGNNLVNIGAASLATVIFTNLLGSSGAGIAVGVMTFLILVFGEITPKTYAAGNSTKVALKVAGPLEKFSFIIYPAVKVLSIISKFISNILGVEDEPISEEELKTLVSIGKSEGIIEKEAAEIMQNVLEFADTKVTDIMTPRPDMVTIDSDMKIKDALDLIVKTPYSRYPILKDGNEIEGILDIDDVLKCIKNKKFSSKVKKLARPIIFVPESKEIDDLLIELEGKEVPMAIVVDEYGEIEGMVTLEDILEEIVGDIFDKSKKTSVYIKKINNKVTRVDGKASIDEVNKILRLGIKGEYFNTLAGFVGHKLQRIPVKGERVKLKNAIIEVDKVTNQRIKSVKIIKK